MHLSRLDLNLLVVFDAVYSEAGITAASRKLNLSQPAVSHALARLRSMLGEPLFERQGRGIVPTPLARSLAPQVRAALATMQRALDEAGRFDPRGAEREFRVGMREALEPSVLPRLAGALCAAGPGLALATARHDRRRLQRDLEGGELDVALDVRLPLADHLPHELVLVDRLVVIGRKGHPALRRRGTRGALPLDEYVALEHVQVSSRRRGPALEDLALRQQGLARRTRLRCQSHAAACRIAAETDLLVTIPATYARQVIDATRHAVVELPLAGLALETYLYWPASAQGDAANRWLREQVKAALAAPAGRKRPG